MKQVPSKIEQYVTQAYQMFEEEPWLSWAEVLQAIAEAHETREPWTHKKTIIEAVNDMRGES